MNIVLFDDREFRPRLYPLTLTRAVADLRVGILTLRQKWEKLTGAATHIDTDSYLQYLLCPEDGFFINASVLPDPGLVNKILQLAPGASLREGENLVAFHGSREKLDTAFAHSQELTGLRWIKRPADLFLHNGAEIANDVALLYPGGSGSTGHSVTDTHTVVYAPHNVYVAEGAQVRAAIINAEAGPVYLGPHSVVAEGSIIIGPFALGEHAALNPGAKMRAGTTIGPYCKAGGEISNSILMAYSNKGHDGFLGNSVLGEWCNLGADTNCSNLKNDYGPVKVWSYPEEDFINTGLQFHGLIMGDHSKAGINTMFNTGTVAGVSANIFGADFPPKFIPSFTWGMGKDVYRFDKALEAANNMMSRRGKSLTEREIYILTKIFENERL